MIRSFLMLLLLLAITAGMIALSRVFGREVNLRWDTYPISVEGFRIYRGLDVVATTAGTTARAELETGDVLHLVAYNAAGVSPPSLPLVIPAPPLDIAGWTVTASSAETTQEDNAPANAIDGNPATIWHTTWGGTLPPHFLRIDLPREATVSGLRYLPRQDGGTNGIVTAYQIELSDDGSQWTEAAAGTWPADPAEKSADLGLRRASHLRLWGQDFRMSAAEIQIIGTYTPDPPASVSLTIQSSADLQAWEPIHTLTVPRTAAEFFRLKIETP